MISWTEMSEVGKSREGTFMGARGWRRDRELLLLGSGSFSRADGNVRFWCLLHNSVTKSTEL